MLIRMFIIIIFLILSLGKEDNEEKIFCQERSRLIRLDRDGEAVIVETIRGNSILLKCSYCDEVRNLEPRVWLYWNVIQDQRKELLTQDRVKITQFNSLVIRNVSNEDAGFYFCRVPYDDSVQSSFNFFVDVQNKSDDRKLLRGDFNRWINYSMEYFVPVNTEITNLELSNIKFEVFSGWSPWSSCETCTENPIQHRTGHCRVKPTPNSFSIPSADPKISKNLLKVLIQTGAAFSCNGYLISYFLPGIFNLIEDIPDFVEERPCEPICPKKGVRDRKQLVLEEGGRAVVPCPGNNVGSKLRWEHNRRRINSVTADGTVAVDRFGVLHFVGVGKGSKGNYTCFFVDNRRLFELRVVIRGFNGWGLGKGFQRHAVYLLIVTMISLWAFLIFVCGLFYLKKKQRKSAMEQKQYHRDQRPLLEDDSDTDSDDE